MGSKVDVDNLKVTDPLGRSILANSDFSADMARWFFTSDHHHLPYHMKNMVLHVLFEQGIVGLAVFGLLVLAALMRSLSGRRAYHPLAPAIVGAIVAFLVVGLFDSLLDVPRVAFLFFLVLLIGIQGRREVH
jgi:O-antigen ligase